MIRLSSSGAQSIRTAIREHPQLWGFLATPRLSGRWRTSITACGCWAMDNDRFNFAPKEWKPAAFHKVLGKLQPWRDKCKFVLVPDVPFDDRATRREFFAWEGTVRGYGYPLGFAAQDGMRVEDVPWTFIDALFIGGSTGWKVSQARALVERAKAWGCWVHVGRVNGRAKALNFAAWGADSIDGTNEHFEPDYACYFWTCVMREANAPQRVLPGFERRTAKNLPISADSDPHFRDCT